MPHHFLVTGGAGFVGSHLCERLLNDDCLVTVLDDLSTGKRANIAHLETKPGFRLVQGSILNDAVLSELMAECDAVFHLASAVGVRLIMEQPVRTIETIVLGTDLVLRHARRFDRKFLLTSTSEVYGKSADIPFREDGDRLEGPTSKHRWAYAAAKALDEFLALAHWREGGLPVVCVRLFNTVGPRQTGQYGMVIPRFIHAAKAGEPLLVHGTGQQTRCFCDVRDVVEAMMLLMNCPEAAGEVFNIGTQEEVSILELARRIIAGTNSTSEIVFVPYASLYGGEGFEDMQRRVPDISKINRTVGWQPRRNLDDILAELAASHTA